MSSHLLKTLPYEDGFVMPAEFEPQSAVWLLVGGAYSHWHNGGFKIRETQVNLAKAINAAGTHVNIGVPNDLYLETEYIFPGWMYPFTRCRWITAGRATAAPSM